MLGLWAPKITHDKAGGPAWGGYAEKGYALDQRQRPQRFQSIYIFDPLMNCAEAWDVFGAIIHPEIMPISIESTA